MRIEAEKHEYKDEQGGLTHVFRLQRAGFTIQKLDGRSVWDFCTACKAPIYMDQDGYKTDDQGQYCDAYCLDEFKSKREPETG